jgi:hypothetical protein
LTSVGAKDFGGGAKLSTSLFYDTNQDHHHIFPTDALKKLNIEDPRANTIVNKTLISSSVNRSIGGNAPSVYLKILEGKTDSIILTESIESHKIDKNILVIDDWQEFMLDRREKLRMMIEKACGGTVHPFTY